MNHDHGLMIHYKKYNQKVYIQICKFILITDSRQSYRFWPPIFGHLQVRINEECIIHNIIWLIDFLCTKSFYNTSLKIAKIQIYNTSNSCMTFYVFHPSISPPWKWPQYNHIAQETDVCVLCNTSFNITSLKMAKIQLHSTSNRYLTFYVIHPLISPPWKWPKYSYKAHQIVVWRSM
jgi:hypothetical protein